MLADDVAGRPYSKAEHNRQLQTRIDRSRTSIEFKHQNISAVLRGLGEDWIAGYKPAFNFQMALVDAVARWLASNPMWLGRGSQQRPVGSIGNVASIFVGPPPTLSNQPPPQELEQMLHIARKFDVAGRDERNRALGRAGEERVLEYERATLKASGRDDLARKRRWPSAQEGWSLSSRRAVAEKSKSELFDGIQKGRGRASSILTSRRRTGDAQLGTCRAAFRNLPALYQPPPHQDRGSISCIDLLDQLGNDTRRNRHLTGRRDAGISDRQSNRPRCDVRRLRGGFAGA